MSRSYIVAEDSHRLVSAESVQAYRVLAQLLVLCWSAGYMLFVLSQGLEEEDLESEDVGRSQPISIAE